MWTEADLVGRRRALKQRMDRMWPRWRTRRRRRALAAAGAVVLAWLVVLPMLQGAVSWRAWGIGFFAGYLCWAAIWLALRILTGAAGEACAQVLDERERAIRDRLGFLGFNVLLVVNVGVALYLIAGHDRAGTAVRGGMLLISLSLAVLCLPTWTLALTLPDDDPVDEVDGIGGPVGDDAGGAGPAGSGPAGSGPAGSGPARYPGSPLDGRRQAGRIR